MPSFGDVGKRVIGFIRDVLETRKSITELREKSKTQEARINEAVAQIVAATTHVALLNAKLEHEQELRQEREQRFQDLYAEQERRHRQELEILRLELENTLLRAGLPAYPLARIAPSSPSALPPAPPDAEQTPP